MRVSSTLFVSCLLALCISGAAHGQERWQWSIVPYLWLSNVGGRSVVGAHQVTMGDSSLTPAFAFRIEGSKRRAGFRVTGTWAHLANPGTITHLDDGAQPAHGRYDFSWITVETHGLLQIGPDDPASSFTAYIGLRYVRQRQLLSDSLLSDIAETQVWLEPVEGSQFAVKVGQRFWFTIAGDIGGFAVGSDFTWTVRAELTFRVAAPFDLGMQYLYREVQYDNKEEGAKTYRWDSGVQQGWFFGAVLALPST